MIPTLIPSFVRQRSRSTITDRKKSLKQNFLKAHTLNEQEIKTAESIILEIGSGNGETATHLAPLYPDCLYIACEVFMDGIIQTCAKMQDKSITNIKFFQNDARHLFLEKKLLKSSVDKMLILFPDPWPKKRHHKRRLLNNEFLKLVFPFMKNGSQILVATDHEDYKNHIRELGNEQILFNFKEEVSAPDWWVLTKYQQKALLENRLAAHFSFTKS